MIFAGKGRAEDAAKNSGEHRKRAAQAMYDGMATLPLQKVYVADFVDASGKRSVFGCYLAATFSKLFADDAKAPAVLSRAKTKKYLKRTGWTDSDLSRPEIASKLASEFAVDDILSGVVSTNRDILHRRFRGQRSIRQGTIPPEIPARYRFHHSRDYSVSQRRTRPGFCFPGLDCVTQQECIHCRSPKYSDAARNGRGKERLFCTCVSRRRANPTIFMSSKHQTRC